MSTVIQNDNKEYDIDVAVVFDKKALGDKGALATTICGSLCHHYKYQPACCNYSFLTLTKSGEQYFHSEMASTLDGAKWSASFLKERFPLAVDSLDIFRKE